KFIEHRTNDLKNGADPQSYMLAGTSEFLESLKNHNVKLYLASGTDHCDMSKEAELLGLSHCFDLILGAPEREASCSKEAVMRRLIEKESLCPSELAVIGDGKVEIALAVEYGAYPLGVASDELAREGINPAKRSRLINAGAAAVIGDFKELDEILGVLGIC
ncbi:MAG: HAD family hydrolase, partial [Clostridiales bacterium]|nr:HAD family hydrolase [Clostridiales bacterium]